MSRRRTPTGCVELAALRKSVTQLGKAERQTFWLTHLGGLAVNLTGAAILWHRRSFAVGATSVLISLPVGPISAYTMPRDTWHLWRDESPAWSVGVGVGRRWPDARRERRALSPAAGRRREPCVQRGGVELAAPLRDDDRRDAVADQVGQRARLGHEAVDAEDQREAGDRHVADAPTASPRAR